MKKKIVYVYENIYFFLTIISVIFSFYGKNKYGYINSIIYVLFLVEYIVRICKAEKKFKFIKEHPLDFIVILPIGDFFRIVRLLRVIRLLKWNYKFTKKFPKLSEVFETNNAGLMIMWLIVFIMVISLPLTFIEPAMKKYSDALWWTVVTTTTVGYGDIVPVTWIGKITAIILMIFGVGTVGLIIGNISNVLINKKRSKKYEYEIPFDLGLFNDLDDEAKQRIMKRIKEEIEFEIFKKMKDS